MTALDWTHAAREVPADGLAVSRKATADEARSLAEMLEIPSVDSLEANYRIASIARGRFSLKGRLDARVTQECVVTLEPVASTLSVPLDVNFSPEIATARDDPEAAPDDLEQPDEEPIENGVMNVGRVVMEELLSNLDPYPRREDAQFDWSDEKSAASKLNPFAALARLKKSGDSE